MIGSKILFAYRKRLINVRLEYYLKIIFVFDIVFLSHITYTINTQKPEKKEVLVWLLQVLLTILSYPIQTA